MQKLPKNVLSEIEKHLLEEKLQVAGQITELSAQDPFSDTDRLNDNAATDTEAKEEIDHERYQAMLQELKDKAAAIESALLRINDGSYGFCVNCHNLIDTDRLAVVPSANLCMSCEARKKN